MGYLRPTAIIVTGLYGDDSPERRHWAVIAREAALEIFTRYGLSQLVGEIVDGIEDVKSFFVAWDGSKEGWPTSESGDQARNEFVRWLRGRTYEDGSSPLHWVEVKYAGDDGGGVVMSVSHRSQPPAVTLDHGERQRQVLSLYPWLDGERRW